MFVIVLSACEKTRKPFYMSIPKADSAADTQGDEIVGVDIEIAKAIAKELGMELVVRDVMFDSIVSGISETTP